MKNNEIAERISISLLLNNRILSKLSFEHIGMLLIILKKCLENEEIGYIENNDALIANILSIQHNGDEFTSFKENVLNVFFKTKTIKRKNGETSLFYYSNELNKAIKRAIADNKISNKKNTVQTFSQVKKTAKNKIAFETTLFNTKRLSFINKAKMGRTILAVNVTDAEKKFLWNICVELLTKAGKMDKKEASNLLGAMIKRYGEHSVLECIKENENALSNSKNPNKKLFFLLKMQQNAETKSKKNLVCI